MAETWLAVQRGVAGFEQRVCLKLVHEHLRDTDDFMRLFVREAAIAASLRHSNIVGVIDASPSAGCMALELVDGTDLGTLLENAPGQRLSAEIVTHLAIELCKALHYAHSRRDGETFAGIVHRDVSPENILISYSGEVKLADFGIAKPIRGTGDVSSGLRGKLSYMSPEQLLGTPVDGRSDLFSLGGVLYEALAGQPPFASSNDAGLWERIRAGIREPVLKWVPECPPLLADAIERLLAVDLERRFGSAAEVIHALAPLTPKPTVYRALGQLARAALPHQTLTLDLPALTFAEDDGLAGAGAELATRTIQRPARVRSTRPLTAPARDGRLRQVGRMVRPAHAGHVAALGAALVSALIPLGVWAFRAQPAPSTIDALPAAPPPSLAIPALAGSSAPSLAPEPPTHPARENPIVVPTSPSAGQRPRRSVRPPNPPVAGRRAPRPQAQPPKLELREPTGRVSVLTFPPTAKIWVDGQLQGRAPLTLRLSPGTHIVAAGQEAPLESRSIEVGPDTAEELFFRLGTVGASGR